MSPTVIHPEETRIPMGWLTWVRDGDDHVSGPYRVRLVEPHRWEVLRDNRHLFFAPRLSAALTLADHHHRDRLRAIDLIIWTAVLLASTGVAGVVELAGDRAGLWVIPLLALAVYGAISAVVRIYAALSRNRFDPYRRRAPWEKHRRGKR